MFRGLLHYRHYITFQINLKYRRKLQIRALFHMMLSITVITVNCQEEAHDSKRVLPSVNDFCPLCATLSLICQQQTRRPIIINNQTLTTANGIMLKNIPKSLYFINPKYYFGIFILDVYWNIIVIFI